jgi:hypothetical protein
MTDKLANQILSWFNSGRDSDDLSKMFRIPESQVVELLAQARRDIREQGLVYKCDLEDSRKRGARKSLLRGAHNKPVTLPKFKCLGETS